MHIPGLGWFTSSIPMFADISAKNSSAQTAETEGKLIACAQRQSKLLQIAPMVFVAPMRATVVSPSTQANEPS